MSKLFENTLNLLNEAKSPSSAKVKYTKDTHKATFRSEFGTYEDDETYTHGNGDGYITDKDGNVYDVYVSDREGDSGYISGGARHFSVSIDYKGTRLNFSGYTALFSNGSGIDIIPDLNKGYYLEDYCAKHRYDFSSRGEEDRAIFNELSAKGDAEAISFMQAQKDKASEKNEKNLAKQSKKYDFTLDGLIDSQSGYPRFSGEIKEGKVLAKSGEKEISEPILSRILEYFGGRDLNDFEGLRFEINLRSPEGVEPKTKSSYAAINNETGKLVYIGEKENKYGQISYKEYDGVRILPRFINLDETAFGEAVVKYAFRHKDEERVKAILNIDSRGNGMLDLYRDCVKIKKDVDARWSPATSGYNLKQLVSTFTESISELKGETRRAASYDIDSRSFSAQRNRSEAEIKMEKWHNGERRQNVKACSDDKLKAYYKICKANGYDDQANILKAEAENRGIELKESTCGDKRYVSGCCSSCGNEGTDTVENFLKKYGFEDIDYSCDILDIDPLEEVCEECFKSWLPELNNRTYSEYNDLGIDTRTGEPFGEPIEESTIFNKILNS